MKKAGARNPTDHRTHPLAAERPKLLAWLPFLRKGKGHSRCGCALSVARPIALRGGRSARGFCGGERGLGRPSQRGKAGGIVGCDVREDLAIQRIAGQLEPVDEGRVAYAVGVAGRVDADDPQRAKLALLLLAPGVGKLQAAFDGLLRCLVELGFGEEVAAGAFQDLLAAVAALGTPFYTGHGGSPFACFAALNAPSLVTPGWR